MRTNKRTATASDACQAPCFNGKLVARLRKELPDDDELEELRVLFSVLADRTRLKLLHALRNGEELCVCDVAHVLGISVSVASHHLRKLRDLQVLKFRNDGKMAYYSLRSSIASELVAQTLKKTAA